MQQRRTSWVLGCQGAPLKADSSWLAGLCPVRSSLVQEPASSLDQVLVFAPSSPIPGYTLHEGHPKVVPSWLVDARCSSGCLVRGASPPSCLAQQGCTPISPHGIISTSLVPNCPVGSRPFSAALCLGSTTTEAPCQTSSTAPTHWNLPS